MQKDPYLILGLTNDATEQQVEDAYKSLRTKYSQLRFEEGEVGASASRMLGELDNAYRDCKDDLRHKVVISNYGNSYGEIEQLIKDNKLEEAQEFLDTCEVRDAEWHYMQARLYYTRQWHSEAKKQLELALELDPTNEKYKNTLAKLIKVMNGGTTANNGAQTNSQTSEQTNGQKQTDNSNFRAGYSAPNSNRAGSDNSGACCDACSTLICMDCCCECFGGDLIPCC